MILVSDGGALATRGKKHIAPDVSSPALCGKIGGSCGHWTQMCSDRANFERLLPERICKTCLRKEGTS